MWVIVPHGNDNAYLRGPLFHTRKKPLKTRSLFHTKKRTSKDAVIITHEKEEV